MEMYEKSLAIKIRALGPEHPDVGLSYNNMGSVLEQQGQHEEAMEMYEKSLAINIRALGPEHPNVGISYNNMGTVLKKQGQYEQAMEMYEKALSLFQALGPSHPWSTAARDNLQEAWSLGLFVCLFV